MQNPLADNESDSLGARGPTCARDGRRRAMRGKAVLTSQEWRSLAARLALSPRELQILQLVFDDEKELAIAESLSISPHTVHTHLGRLYRKLGVSSRCEAVVKIFGEHLADLSAE